MTERTSKMKMKKFLSLILAAFMVIGCGITTYADDDYDDDHAEHYEYYYDRNGKPITGLYYGYINKISKGMDYGNNNYEGYNDRMSRMRKFFTDGQFDCFYTGYIKDKTGKRYYDNGWRVTGWYNTEDGWRHFDADGYMSVGKTKICGVNYYFDENGVWTGKFGKNGKVPDDFSVSIKEIDFGSGGFDSGSLKIYFQECWYYDDGGKQFNGNTSQDIKISKRDKQVLYSMFQESGLADVKVPEKLNKEYLQNFMDKNNKDGKYYRTEGNYRYALTVTADGKTYSVEYAACLIGQIASKDKTAGAVISLSDSLKSYHAVLKEKFPQEFTADEAE